VTNILNSARSFKSDFVEGITKAYPQFVERIPDASGVRVPGAPLPAHVSVLIGGGSGHYPAFAGLVGPGLATGAVIGEVFTSPSAEQIFRCTVALDGGRGVIYSYGNYSGDVMNFDMSAERAAEEGIHVRTVLITDDVASAPPERRADRRGIAGDFCVYKILGAAAATGAGLDDVVEFGIRANDRTRTIGVAFRGCTLPGASGPLFSVPDDCIELGLGIHGEPGLRRTERVDARTLAELMVTPLLAECPDDSEGRVAVLVNGLGSTSGEELFTLFSEVARSLESSELKIEDCEVGEFVTSLDMSGCSLTLLWLDDDLAGLYDAPAASAGYRKLLP
jgi:dihydroxyacetone kinase